MDFVTGLPKKYELPAQEIIRRLERAETTKAVPAKSTMALVVIAGLVGVLVLKIPIDGAFIGVLIASGFATFGVASLLNAPAVRRDDQALYDLIHSGPYYETYNKIKTLRPDIGEKIDAIIKPFVMEEYEREEMH